MGGDFNSKHTFWGSRLTNPKGRQLLKSVQKNRINVLSGASPTYWPSDPAKVPDLLDFFVHKGLPTQSFSIENSYDLSSDHSPVILTCCRAVASRCRPKVTNYPKFRENIIKNLPKNIRLKTPNDIDQATEFISKSITEEIDNCSKVMDSVRSSSQYSLDIRLKIREKRRIRAQWQRTRDPRIKSQLNRASKELKEELKSARDLDNEDRIKNLTATKITDFSLWNELKHINKPTQRREPLRSSTGGWIRSDREKAIAFKHHLSDVFTPFEGNNNVDDIRKMIDFIDCPLPVSLELPPITAQEVNFQISRLNARKAPGSDGVPARALKNLPPQGVTLLLHLFNAILRLGHFPPKWKLAKVVMILKPGKPASDIASYRPISILSVLSKLFERIVLRRMLVYMRDSIPDHQFGFRAGHGTPEQCHRVVEFVKKSFEKKEYVSGVFIDVSQAFDKVWHPGLLYKIKRIFHPNLFILIKSFLSHRKFIVQIGEEQSEIGSIKSGVPQGSVLGPHLYLLYTHDLPQLREGFSGTFADDTTFLCADSDPARATNTLQIHLNSVEAWANRWNIKINTSKCQHITFTLNKADCPPISFGGQQIAQPDTVKYLGLHLDRRLTFGPHVKMKRKELDLKRKKYYYILNKNSPLSLKNKILIYKVMLKPVWTYCLPLWGLASNSSIEIIQRFQNISLRVCTGALNYISNEDLHKDLSIPSVKTEIVKAVERYRIRLTNHPNALANSIINTTLIESRLKKKLFINL